MERREVKVWMRTTSQESSCFLPNLSSRILKVKKEEKAPFFFFYFSAIIFPFSSNKLRTAGMEGKERYK